MVRVPLKGTQNPIGDRPPFYLVPYCKRSWVIRGTQNFDYFKSGTQCLKRLGKPDLDYYVCVKCRETASHMIILTWMQKKVDKSDGQESTCRRALKLSSYALSVVSYKQGE